MRGRGYIWTIHALLSTLCRNGDPLLPHLPQLVPFPSLQCWNRGRLAARSASRTQLQPNTSPSHPAPYAAGLIDIQKSHSLSPVLWLQIFLFCLWCRQDSKAAAKGVASAQLPSLFISYSAYCQTALRNNPVDSRIVKKWHPLFWLWSKQKWCVVCWAFSFYQKHLISSARFLYHTLSYAC